MPSGYWEQIHEGRRAKNVCVSCGDGKPWRSPWTLRVSAHCRECLDKQARSQRNLRARRRRAGICIHCDRLRLPFNKQYCARHRALANARAVTAKRKARECRK